MAILPSPAESAPPADAGVVGRSLWQDARARLAGNRAAVASLVLLAAMALACLLGPVLSPHAYDAIYPAYVKVPASLDVHPDPARLEPDLRRVLRRARLELDRLEIDGETVTMTVRSSRPIDPRATRYLERSDLFDRVQVEATAEGGRTMTVSARLERHRFVFGTDANGRDLMTRTLIAGRVSLTIGLLASLVALVIGVAYGAVSGYLGGRVDLVMMRVVDVLYSLPFIFFVILLVVFFGRNFVLMFVAVGAVEWLDMARIVRGQTLSLKHRDFVEAARVLGVGTPAILSRHIVPNLVSPVIVTLTLMVPRVILLESFLSFLGLGVQEPMTSWGVLIAEGARNIQGAPWMLAFPALFLVATLMALNFLGDGLRDALDPGDR